MKLNKKFNKIVLSFLLVLAMITGNLVGAVPGTSMTAKALTGTGVSTLPSLAGTYYLTQDVNLSSSWGITEDIVLDLNGHGIKRADEYAGILIFENGSLTLTDSGNNAEHTHYYTVAEDGLATVDDSKTTGASTFTGGYITGGSFDGGVSVCGGTFTMTGGTIIGNSAYQGGGVSVSNGTFTMNGGTITGNSAYQGGGVSVYGGTFTMTGGTITGNTAFEGGGVYCQGDFNVGGTVKITGNSELSDSEKTDSNVYLFRDANGISVIDSLSGDTSIGVTMDVRGIFTSGLSGKGDLSNFTSDNAACIIKSSENGEAKLALPDVSYVDHVVDGSTSEAVDKSRDDYYKISEIADDGKSWGWDGWYVLDADTTISDRVTVNGTANIILKDEDTLTANSGITVSVDNKLNIYAQTKGSGALTATAESSSNMSGIGGTDNSAGGNITIYGGNVTATGDGGAAGIGGGKNSTGSNVSVYGGTVHAIASDDGVGIGAGNGSSTNGTLTLGTGMYLYGNAITANPENNIQNYVAQEQGDYARTRYMTVNNVPPHEHSFTYTAGTGNETNTITAKCTENCPDHYDTNGITIVLNTPESLTYSGTVKEATISGYPDSVPTGLAAAPTSITYYKSSGVGSTTINGEALTGAPADAGNYVAQMTWGGKTASVAFTIEKLDITASASDVNTTYDGGAHGISVNVTTPANGYTIKYGTASDNCTLDSSPTITNVSDSPLTVYYRVSAENYNDYIGSATVTLTRAAQEAPSAPAKNQAEANRITLVAHDGYEYKCGDGDWQTDNVFTGLTTDTEYTFYQRLAEDSNHDASRSSTGTVISTTEHEHDWSFSAEGAVLTATCKDTDGGHGTPKTAALTINAPALTIYGGTGSAEAFITGSIDGVSNPAIVYKKGDEILKAAPVDAGTYTANIALGDATATVEYTIEKATATVDVQGITTDYDGKEHSISVAVTESVDAVIRYKGPDDKAFTVTNPSFIVPGEYTVAYEVTSANYKTVSGTAIVKIKGAEFGDITAVDYTGVYDGQEHGITVTKPDVAEVKITYSETEDGTYSDSPAVYKDVTNGAKTVYYKVSATGYNDKKGSATVTITKKDVTVTPDENQSKTYGADDPTFTYTVNGLVEGEKLTGVLSREKGEDVGLYDYTIGTLDSENSNYNVSLADNSSQFEITKPVSDATADETKVKEEPKEEKYMFGGLKITQNDNRIKIKWDRIPTADGYQVYVTYCGKKFGRAVKTIKKNRTLSVVIKKLNGKKIKLKKNFKAYVTAYKMVNGKKVRLAKSITGHVAGRKNTKFSNTKSIKLATKSVSIAAGETVKVKAKTVLVSSKKKQLGNQHVKEFRYASTNKKVATVDRNGRIKGVGTGTCIVYVYARNGYAKKVSVAVK